MAFLIVHTSNGFCGREPMLVNADHVMRVSPVRGGLDARRWSVDACGALIHLYDGSSFVTEEPFDAIMGMLREAQGGARIPGTGLQLAKQGQ